ncbi:hypothetical protein MMC10_010566 [Thelotrema lepadinum]|nr:hypothetical protein [Thelotrema lepadinum]
MLDLFCCSKCRKGKDKHATQQVGGHGGPEGTSSDHLNDCLQGINGNGRMSDAWITVTDTDGDNNPQVNRIRKTIRSRLSARSSSPVHQRSNEHSIYSITGEGQERPTILKWALPKPAPKDLRVGQITSWDGYDSDAIVILTPAVSQPQSDADVGDSSKRPTTEAELRAGRTLNQKLPERKENARDQHEKKATDIRQPGIQQHCNDKSSITSTHPLKTGVHSTPRTLFPNLPSSDAPSRAVTFAKEPLKRRAVPIRESLPNQDACAPGTLESSKRLSSTHDTAALGGSGRNLQDKGDHGEGKTHGIGLIDDEARSSPQSNTEQGSMENVPPEANALSTVLIPPKSPSRSASSSSSEATRRQLRAVSSSSYTGDSTFCYTGSYRPQVQEFVTLPKTRKRQQPRKSRFREEFHISRPPSIGASFDGNDDRPPISAAQSHRRRAREPGIMPHSEEATAMWEKALAFHAKEVANRKRSPYSPFRANMWSASRRNLAPPSQLDTWESERLGRKRILSIDSADIAPDVVVAHAAIQQPLLQKDRPQGTWSRYPSHTRSDRTTSAGSQDHVSTWDFAKEYELPAKAVSMIERTKRKRKPLPGSRNFFDIIKDRWVNERSDLLRMERGYRSSVSVGGELKYPDLELLPNMEPVHPPPPSKRDISSNFSNPVSSDDSALLDDGRDTSPRSDVTAFANDARVWSKVYRAYVPTPPFSSEFRNEGEQTSGNNSGFLSPSYVPRRPSKMVSPGRRSTHSDSALDVRKSTVDFSESLRLKMEMSRKSLVDGALRMELGKVEHEIRE